MKGIWKEPQDTTWAVLWYSLTKTTRKTILSNLLSIYFKWDV